MCVEQVPRFLQCIGSLGAGSRRQVDYFSELGVGDIGLQVYRGQYLAVDGVELAVASSPLLTLGMLSAGALILTLIGCLTAAIGSNTRLSSYMLNRIAFGRNGATLVNLAFAVSLLGWFGVNIDLFSGAVQRLAADLFGVAVPGWPIEIFAGFVMTVTTLLGFRAINLLSTLLVPVLVVVTAQLIAGSLDARSLPELLAASAEPEISFGDGEPEKLFPTAI